MLRGKYCPESFVNTEGGEEVETDFEGRLSRQHQGSALTAWKEFSASLSQCFLS